jgi:phospholipid-translocating ATPase
VFPTNKVTTTRFNIFNFLPITILLQFTKVINVFYLGNAILQSFPSVSTNDPLFTIIPLSILIFLGVLKEGLADYKRYKIDKTTNAAPVHRLTGRIIPKKSNTLFGRNASQLES